MSKSNSTSKKQSIERVITVNVAKLQIERYRLLSRLNRARTVMKNLLLIASSPHTYRDTEFDRLLDQYESFIAEVEMHIDHYEYKINKIKKGLQDAVSIKEKSARNLFLSYISEDATRTIANLRLVNTEYQEILAFLPAEGLDQ